MTRSPTVRPRGRRRSRVFMNVPYDGFAQQRVDALELAVVAADHEPLFVGDVDEPGPDAEHIEESARQCVSFVHDLWWDSAEGARRVPRGNNVFELGLCLGVRSNRSQHLLLARRGAVLDEMLSDVCGAEESRPPIREAVSPEDLFRTVVEHLGSTTSLSAARIRWMVAAYPERRCDLLGRSGRYRCDHRVRPGLTWRFALQPAARFACATRLLKEAGR